MKIQLDLSPLKHTSSDRKLVMQRIELTRIVKDAEEALTEVNKTLLERVKEKGVDNSLRVGSHTVTVVKRPLFGDVTLAVAAKYNAIKSVVDSSKLLPLLAKGRRIKGVAYTEYVTVK